MPQTLFPTTLFVFSQYWPFYLIFIIFIFVILFLDLGIFNRKDHVVSVKEALIWSCVWIILAIAFNLFFYFYATGKSTEWYLEHIWAIPKGMTAQTAGAIEGKNSGLEFLAGYIIEKTLALDNIFVFVMIFKYFETPLKYQHKILFFGILGALFFRAIFISIGAELVEYDWVLILFGGFLILTGIKLLFMPEKEKDIGSNFLIRWFRKSGWVSTKNWEEIQGRFFIRENGKIFITTLFLVLILIEFSDIVFAVDSVPAIFAITREPLIVFTSNIFAILGLRSLYFLLANMVEKFEYLKYGLAVILVFVGIKMAWLNNLYGGKFPISISLAFIFLVLVVCTVVSVVKLRLRPRM
ncbi:MAG: TerC/Alx family metal homeostasis membrane protein [Bdellovibrionota bacterium]